MTNKNSFLNILILTLLVLLTIAGIIAYKNIDWNVLNKIESQQLILPTPIPQTPTATPSSTIQE